MIARIGSNTNSTVLTTGSSPVSSDSCAASSERARGTSKAMSKRPMAIPTALSTIQEIAMSKNYILDINILTFINFHEDTIQG